ncbi:MAG: histidine kinase, partial [Bacteroidota bacterium]
QLRYWSVASGFPYNDIRKIHIQDGKIYVIAQHKLIRIDENMEGINRFPPRVFLNRIVVNGGQEIPIDSNYRFTHEDRRIRFLFNGLAFRSGQYLQYQYRLTGLDDEWHTITQPFVEFPSLSPGTYHFELVALNENNTRSAVPVAYHFVIPLPFWETDWFYACIISVAIMFIALIFRYRFRAEQKRNREREAMLQYEQQALSAQINPHFLFNALNSIQNFILQEDKSNAIKYLGRFSKLMRSSLDHARMKWISPAEEMNLLENYLELEKMRFKDKFIYQVDVPDEQLSDILIPSMLIQPFIENAILHGVAKLENRQGQITVKLVWKDTQLLCSVTDNGIGLGQAGAEYSQRSHGMNITLERLKLLCAETATVYFFGITDRKAEEKKGTHVTFHIPYKRN